MSKSKECICGEKNPDNFYKGYATKCKKCKIEESIVARDYKTKKELFIFNLENNILRYTPELSKISSDKKLVEKISEFILNSIVQDTIEETFPDN